MHIKIANISSTIIMTMMVINRRLIFNLIILYFLTIEQVLSINISSVEINQTNTNSQRRIITSLKPHCSSGNKCEISKFESRESRQDFFDSDENIIKTIANVLESDELITALARVPLWITTISAINRAVNDALNGTNTPSLGSFFIQQGSEAVKFFQAITGVVQSIPGGGAPKPPPVYPGQLFRPRPQVSTVNAVLTENPAYHQQKPAVGRPGYEPYPGIAPNKEAASGVFAGSVGYIPVETFPDELSYPTYPPPTQRPRPQYQQHPIKVTSPPVQVRPQQQSQLQSNGVLEVNHGWIQSPELVENIFDTLQNLDTFNNVAITERPQFQPNAVLEPETDSFLEYLEKEYLNQQQNQNHYGNSLKKGIRETTTQKIYFTERTSTIAPFRIRPTTTIESKRHIKVPFTYRPMPSRDSYLPKPSTQMPYRPTPTQISYGSQSTEFPFRPRPTTAPPTAAPHPQPNSNTNHVHIHINFLHRPDLGTGMYQANYEVHPEKSSKKSSNSEKLHSQSSNPSYAVYQPNDKGGTMVHLNIDIPNTKKSDPEISELFTKNGIPTYLKTSKAPNIYYNNFKSSKYVFTTIRTATTGKPVYWMNMYYPNGFPENKVKGK